MTKLFAINRGSMKRELRVADIFAIGYGDLGSSIYYALGITALYALGATPLALLFAGMVFVCTALTYAELSSVVHEAGGTASFSRKAFNDLISFVAGWALLLDYIVTISISAFSIAPYLAIFSPVLKDNQIQVIVTILVIILLLIVNILGTKHSTRLSMILTFLTLITQFIIIGIGVVLFVNIPELFEHMKVGVKNSLWSPTWTEFAKGVAMAMVAYTGIESMSQLSAEAKNPAKTVPKAIMLSMVILLVTYVGVSFVALSVMTPQVLSTTYLEDPLSGIVANFPFAGKLMMIWVGLLAAVILLVAANAGLMGASRLAFYMGELFQIPRSVYRLHPKFHTPYVALTIFAFLAIGIIIWSWGRLSFLGDLYNFGAMMAFFFAHISLIKHRIKYPDEKRPFKVKGNIVIKNREIPISAVIGATVSAAVWFLVVVTKPHGRYLGFAWLAIGIAMYLFHRKKYHIPATGHLEIEKIQIPGIQEMHIKSILVPTRGGTSTQTILFACQIAKAFNAKLKVLHVVDIPFFMPLNTAVLQREAFSEEVLKRAQAVGNELNVDMELKMVRSRSVYRTIYSEVKEGKHDALVLGASQDVKTGLGSMTEKLLKTVPCYVFVCRHNVTTEKDNNHYLFDIKEDEPITK